MVARNGYNTVVGRPLREDDVTPVYTPLYHAGGLGVLIVPMFAIGGTIRGGTARGRRACGILGRAARQARAARDHGMVESLPRTPYGKIVKGELKERYLRDKGHQ
jgi:acyl-CoA synthetase (AMP-forming)/AMP-acid ligase II